MEEGYRMTGEWRGPRNEELCGLYSSPNIIRFMKSKRMRWAGHVAHMGRRKMFLGKPEGGGPLRRAARSWKVVIKIEPKGAGCKFIKLI